MITISDLINRPLFCAVYNHFICLDLRGLLSLFGASSTTCSLVESLEDIIFLPCLSTLSHTGSESELLRRSALRRCRELWGAGASPFCAIILLVCAIPFCSLPQSHIEQCTVKLWYISENESFSSDPSVSLHSNRADRWSGFLPALALLNLSLRSRPVLSYEVCQKKPWQKGPRVEHLCLGWVSLYSLCQADVLVKPVYRAVTPKLLLTSWVLPTAFLWSNPFPDDLRMHPLRLHSLSKSLTLHVCYRG